MRLLPVAAATKDWLMVVALAKLALENVVNVAPVVVQVCAELNRLVPFTERLKVGDPLSLLQNTLSTVQAPGERLSTRSATEPVVVVRSLAVSCTTYENCRASS